MDGYRRRYQFGFLLAGRKQPFAIRAMPSELLAVNRHERRRQLLSKMPSEITRIKDDTVIGQRITLRPWIEIGENTIQNMADGRRSGGI